MPVNPLAEYDTQIADLRAQMEPIQQRLRAVAEERRDYADLIAEDTDDEQTLAAIRDASQIAFNKLSRLVRDTTHPAIWNFTDWMPIEDDYTTGYLMGPHLAEDRIKPGEEEALAASMLDFAARFCAPAPDRVEWMVATASGVDVSGMVFADVLDRHAGSDEGSCHQWALFYGPDGSRAVLLDGYTRGKVAEGTLVEVLAYLASPAARA